MDGSESLLYSRVGRSLPYQGFSKECSASNLHFHLSSSYWPRSLHFDTSEAVNKASILQERSPLIS